MGTAGSSRCGGGPAVDPFDPFNLSPGKVILRSLLKGRRRQISALGGEA